MRRTTHWMLAIGYYTSQFLGIIAFSYNYNTGKAKTKPIITLHSAVMSIAMFGIIPLLCRADWNLTKSNVPDLHVKIYGTVCLIRISAVLVAVVMNWTKRKDFIKTVNEFQHFRSNFLRKWPMSKELERTYEISFRSKFIFGCLSNVFIIAGCLVLLQKQLNVKNPLIALLVAVMGTILNLIVGHFFFAVINVNVLLAAINVEVKRSVQMSLKLSQQQRSKQIKQGALITWCCKLADDLDDLALAQHRLKNLANRIHAMYDIQITCIALDIYLTSISSIYMASMLLYDPHLAGTFSRVELYGFVVSLAAYYLDLRLLLLDMLRFESQIKDTNQLLIDYQPPLPTLDVRLEDSPESVSRTKAFVRLLSDKQPIIVYSDTHHNVKAINVFAALNRLASERKRSFEIQTLADSF